MAVLRAAPGGRLSTDALAASMAPSSAASPPTAREPGIVAACAQLTAHFQIAPERKGAFLDEEGPVALLELLGDPSPKAGPCLFVCLLCSI